MNSQLEEHRLILDPDHQRLPQLVWRKLKHLWSVKLLGEEECIGIGMLTLVECAKSYTKMKGSFAGYAVRSIFYNVLRAARNVGPFRIPKGHPMNEVKWVSLSQLIPTGGNRGTEGEGVSPESLIPDPKAVDPTEEAEKAEIVHLAKNHEDEETRLIFELIFEKGQSLRQVAEKMGYCHQTIDNKLKKGLSSLTELETTGDNGLTLAV